MNCFPAIAAKLAQEPELLQHARATLQHWSSIAAAPPARIHQWSTILADASASEGGMARLLALLKDDSEEARRIKDFAPFAGILTRQERQKIIAACTYDH